MNRWRSILYAALLLPPAVQPARAADELLYVVEGDTIVFTNVPTHDSRPVPGFGKEVLDGPAASMPVTIYDAFIDRVARETGVPPRLIKAVAMVESNLNPHAVSPKGAQGLMQLMPATARGYGVEDSFDPLQNLRAGALHLRSQMDTFGGDVTLALAAYNAGASVVKEHGGVPSYRETREYVRRVHEKMGPKGSSEPPRRQPAPSAEPSGGAIRTVIGANGSVTFEN